MKSYVFNNEKYGDLNSLAQAYAANFKLGVEDVFTNYKKFVKFVKSLAKDKVSLVVDYLSKSKYKNDALTFIIFELLDEKKVYFNGVELSFDEFLAKLKDNPDPNNNLLYVFLEDGGLSKTYARFDIVNLERDAKFIERNIADPFVFEYLTSYNNYEKRDPFVQINSEILDSPRAHDKFLKKIKEYDFMMNLAHYEFTSVYEALHDQSPTFEVLAILYRIDNTKADELLKVLTNTPEMWLVDHLKSYKPKTSQAKELFKKINNTVLNSQKKVKPNKKNPVVVDEFTKKAMLHNELFDEYSLFATYFADGDIVVKKKQEDLMLKIEYAGTLVSSNYMLEIPDEEVEESIATNIMPVIAPVAAEAALEAEQQAPVTEAPAEGEVVAEGEAPVEVAEPTEQTQEGEQAEVTPEGETAPENPEEAAPVEGEAQEGQEAVPAEATEGETPTEPTDEPTEPVEEKSEEAQEEPKEETPALETPADEVKLVETKPENKSQKNLDLKAINKTKKINHKNRSFGGYVIFISVLNAIIISLVAFLPKAFVNNTGLPQQIRDIITKLVYNGDATQIPTNFLYYAIISGGLFVLNLVLAIILKSLSKKNEKKLMELQIYMNSNPEIELGKRQQEAKDRVGENLDEYKKCVRKKYHIFGIILGFFHAVSVSILGLMICLLLPNFVQLPINLNTNPSMILFMIGLFSGAVLTVLLLLFKRKKSRWYILILDLLALASTFVCLAYIPL